MKGLLRWLPLLGALVALMAWNEARSVDYVTAHIECPDSFRAKYNLPEKIGADPPFYPEMMPYEMFYFEPRIARHSQRVECTYTRNNSSAHVPPKFGYTVQRKIVNCEQKSPRALDCLVHNKY